MPVWGHDPGAYFEKCLEAEHTRYEWERRASIDHTYPAVKFFTRGTGTKRKRVVVPVEKALPDYVGVTHGGRCLVVEAKTWRAKSEHRLRKRMHQAIYLQRKGRLLALAGYIVGWRWQGALEVRWYPISELDIKSDRRGEYIEFTRAAGARVRGFDWLTTALEDESRLG